MRTSPGVVLVAAVLVVACGGGGGTGEKVCGDAACLWQALDEFTARDGGTTTIRLEPGSFEGTFEIPGGVTLVGAGPSSELAWTGEGPAVVVPGSAGETVLRDLGIRAGAGGGILAGPKQGAAPGGLTLQGVTVDVTGRIGVAARNMACFRAEDLELVGNVTEQDEGGIGQDASKERWAISGLAIWNVGQADLTDIDVHGFALSGVEINASTAMWDGGELRALVGSAVHVSGGAEATVQNLLIHDIWDGQTRYGYGLVASEAAHLVTGGVTIHDNEQAGILVHEATGEFDGLDVRGNQGRGVWIQHCHGDGTVRAVTVRNATLADNLGVAFGVFQSRDILLEDGRLDSTRKQPMRLYIDQGTEDIGDGIEVVASTELTFKRLTLDSNARAGVVVDGRNVDGDVQVSFDDVTISGNGERGFAVQHGEATGAPEVTDPGLQQADAEALAAGTTLGVAADLTDIPPPVDIIIIDH